MAKQGTVIIPGWSGKVGDLSVFHRVKPVFRREASGLYRIIILLYTGTLHLCIGFIIKKVIKNIKNFKCF
jgi:hypothetical protein